MKGIAMHYIFIAMLIGISIMLAPLVLGPAIMLTAMELKPKLEQRA